MNDETTYFRNRELIERQLADEAPSPIIRKIHLELADRYRELADNPGLIPDADED